MGPACPVPYRALTKVGKVCESRDNRMFLFLKIAIFVEEVFYVYISTPTFDGLSGGTVYFAEISIKRREISISKTSVVLDKKEQDFRAGYFLLIR